MPIRTYFMMPRTRRLASFLLIIAVVLPLASGCPSVEPQTSAPTDAPPGPPRTLEVLVIDDDPLATALQRQWQARSDTPINLRRATTDEVRAAADSIWATDVVVFPSGLLGELAEHERIVPLAKRQFESDEFARQDVFELLRRGETAWGEESFAVALGSPQLTLLYRRDLFESLDLIPPTTWSDYQQLVDRLAQRDAVGDAAPVADQIWYATREPLGEGWAGQLLLARAAAYVRHPNQYSTLFDLRDMRPLIDGAPFVRALEELVKAAESSSDGTHTQQHAATPAQVRKDFFAGRCAMALTWPTSAEATRSAGPTSGDAASSTASDPAPDRPLEVRFAALPGSASVYNFRSQMWEDHPAGDVTRVPLVACAGRLAAVTRSGRRSSSATTMLLWLGGVELGNTVAPTSSATTLFRASQINSSRRWVNPEVGDRAARQYGDLVRDTQTQSVWLTSVRIPGRQRYLAALDAAVQRALAGESAQLALSAAASTWQQITAELGRDQQQSAYSRSIGLEP